MLSNPENLSNTFYRALGSIDHNYAVQLYTKEIEHNDPLNFVAWNNRGVSKIHLAIEKEDLNLIDGAILDFQKAINLANEYDGNGFDDAQKNIEWAKTISENIKAKK
jgi:hypothetical protein